MGGELEMEEWEHEWVPGPARMQPLGEGISRLDESKSGFRAQERCAEFLFCSKMGQLTSSSDPLPVFLCVSVCCVHMTPICAGRRASLASANRRLAAFLSLCLDLELPQGQCGGHTKCDDWLWYTVSVV